MAKTTAPYAAEFRQQIVEQYASGRRIQARTPGLYDRRNDEVSLDEVERIQT